MSNSGLTPYQDELLEILAEECGELIQEKSKIFRFGINEASMHIDGKSHRECLIQEMGDMLAMLDLVSRSQGISRIELEFAKDKKLNKVVKWMTHKKED